MIVLFGVKGSGKDTAAAKMTQFNFRPTSFAEPLKAMVAIAFPEFSRSDLYGSSDRRETPYRQYEFGRVCLDCGGDDFDLCNKDGTYSAAGGADGELYTHFSCQRCAAIYPKYITPRIALQTLGTQWGRRLHPSIWASAGLRRAHSLYGIITDGRFRNELEAAQRSHAHTVLLLRGLAESTDPHPSEAELREMAKDETWATGPGKVFDYVIDNRGTLEELTGLVLRMHDWHCQKHGKSVTSWE